MWRFFYNFFTEHFSAADILLELVAKQKYFDIYNKKGILIIRGRNLAISESIYL